MKRSNVAIAAVAAIAYAWWVTAVAPFTALAYVLIGIPCLSVVSLYVAMGALSPRSADITTYYRHQAGDQTIMDCVPWLAILAGVVILEIVGLVLGGRSPNAPTLSTMVDHLLAEHWERFVLYVTWLAVGVNPLRQLSRELHNKAS